MGPTLLGGLIGAVAGMVLHLLVESTTGFEASWFAIVIGVLTGLGVRQANKSLAGRVSYARGAVAAVIALAAIVLSPQLIARVAANKGGPTVVAGAAKADAAKDDADDSGPVQTASDDTTVRTAPGELRGGTPAIGAQSGVMRPGDFNVWQFAFMAVGTFIAYEFGRGTAPRDAAPSSAVDEPVAMDPSN